jgi:hypothetical protein
MKVYILENKNDLEKEKEYQQYSIDDLLKKAS